MGSLQDHNEPVAWRYKIVDCFGRPVWTLKTPKTDTRVLESQPLYANPQTIDKSAAIRIATALGLEPKREWVGLTDGEIEGLLPPADGSAEENKVRVEVQPGIWGVEYEEVDAWSLPLVRQAIRAIEAKLKEKNT